MLGRALLSVAATLALATAAPSAQAQSEDSLRRRAVNTPPQITDRGRTAAHVCFDRGWYEDEQDGFREVEPLPCTQQFAPLVAAAGDTVRVRTLPEARGVRLQGRGPARECGLLEAGRWLCWMPNDASAALRVQIAYSFGAATWSYDSQLRALRRSARLLVALRAAPSDVVYTEGALQVVRLRRIGEKGPFLVRALTHKNLSVRLPAGTYELSSTTRSCSGSCPQRNGTGSLDAPSGTCSSRLTVERGERLAATVVTCVGERCRIR